jgi:hypothetical protein
VIHKELVVGMHGLHAATATPAAVTRGFGSRSSERIQIHADAGGGRRYRLHWRTRRARVRGRFAVGVAAGAAAAASKAAVAIRPFMLLVFDLKQEESTLPRLLLLCQCYC